MNEKTIELIGEKNVQKIKEKSVLLVGLGGVGGAALEALVRSGISKITLIDNDVFDTSNLNRQILATISTLNKEKTEIAKKRVLDINKELEIITHQVFLTKDNINILGQYDYIIDACDTVDTKISLIRFAEEKNIKIISCMGTGKRIDSTKIKVSTLNKTYNDPLAKIIRKKVKDAGLKANIAVVFSEELPINNKQEISSMIFVPMIAGLYLANYVIEDIIKE